MENDFKICPKCGSKKTDKDGMSGPIITGIVLIFVSIWFFWIPFVMIGLMIVGVLSLLSSPSKLHQWKCKDCNHTWKEEKKNITK
jgi:uncharacterized membrane protein YraQ (UPF0718 family)